MLEALIAGQTDSDIANATLLSQRTIEMHRANIMKRLGTASLIETLRVAYDAGLRPGSQKLGGGRSRNTKIKVSDVG